MALSLSGASIHSLMAAGDASFDAMRVYGVKLLQSENALSMAALTASTSKSPTITTKPFDAPEKSARTLTKSSRVKLVNNASVSSVDIE